MPATYDLSPDELEVIRVIRQVRNTRKPATFVVRVEESCITVNQCEPPQQFRRRPLTGLQPRVELQAEAGA